MNTNRYPSPTISYCLLVVVGFVGVCSQLSPAEEAPRAALRIEERGGALVVLEDDRPALAYNFGVQKKAGVPDDRARSSYVHIAWKFPLRSAKTCSK